MYKSDEQNNTDQQRNTLEAKVKKLDEQIILLNDLKNQYLTKLQSLSQVTPHLLTANP